MLLTWEPGNTGKPTIPVTWEPGNIGKPMILSICEPGNTGTPTFFSICEPEHIQKLIILDSSHSVVFFHLHIVEFNRPCAAREQDRHAGVTVFSNSAACLPECVFLLTYFKNRLFFWNLLGGRSCGSGECVSRSLQCPINGCVNSGDDPESS